MVAVFTHAIGIVLLRGVATLSDKLSVFLDGFVLVAHRMFLVVMRVVSRITLSTFVGVKMLVVLRNNRLSG